MKTVKKNVYYCDYCNKRGLSASHIMKHENHCTANPDRECRLCESGIDLTKIIDKLKTRFRVNIKEEEEPEGWFTEEVEWIGKEITVDEIRDLADDCPNCMLAIIRQSGLSHPAVNLGFKYREENAKYWQDKMNEESRQQEYESIYY